MKQLSDKEKDYFDKQLDGFIKEVQERFHLSYEEAVWIIFDRSLHLLPKWKENFFQNVQEYV